MIFRVFCVVLVVIFPLVHPLPQFSNYADVLHQISSVTFLENLPATSAGPFIIHGERAAEGEIPYQAYLISRRNNSDRGALCGGSLIKPKWVLTAAHCVEDTDQTIVQMGSNEKKSMTYKETSYFRVVHVLYNSLTLYNDVALVRLPVAAKGDHISIIPVAPKDFSDLADEEVQASGFGLTANKGDVPDHLNKVTLIAVTQKECRNTYGALFVLKSTLCAKYSTKKGQSTCNGDSGGPLVYKANDTVTYLVGVTSFVSGAGCDSGNLAAFGRVSAHYDWIETNTKKYENANFIY